MQKKAKYWEESVLSEAKRAWTRGRCVLGRDNVYNKF